MINWIANLLGINKTQDNANAEQDEKPIERCYYKIKVKSYYGLGGIKSVYREADLIAVPIGHLLLVNPNHNPTTEDCRKVVVGVRGSITYCALMPRDAEFISEQEYLEVISK